MSGSAGSFQIAVNVAFQIVNMGLFFWIGIRFLGKPLTQSLLKKIEYEKKLADASLAYESMIVEAEDQKKSILKEALVQKEEIIQEAALLAQKKADDIVLGAQKKADILYESAEKKGKQLELELQEGFMNGVKKITQTVVTKLVGKDHQLQDVYLDSLIKEATQ